MYDFIYENILLADILQESEKSGTGTSILLFRSDLPTEKQERNRGLSEMLSGYTKEIYRNEKEIQSRRKYETYYY